VSLWDGDELRILRTFISSGGISTLVGARSAQRREGRVNVGRRIVALAQVVGFAGELLWRMWGGAHLLAIVQIRVGRVECPLGGLWIRQLGGLVDDGIDGAGEAIGRMGDRPMSRVPRVMRQFIVQGRRVGKGLGGVIFIHRVL